MHCQPFASSLRGFGVHMREAICLVRFESLVGSVLCAFMFRCSNLTIDLKHLKKLIKYSTLDMSCGIHTWGRMHPLMKGSIGLNWKKSNLAQGLEFLLGSFFQSSCRILLRFLNDLFKKWSKMLQAMNEIIAHQNWAYTKIFLDK